MIWAASKFATVELGEKRLVKLKQQLAAKPAASIPGACGGWGDTAAAYRILDDERCDWREIIEDAWALCCWRLPRAQARR